AAAPVRAAVEVLPGRLDLGLVAADQRGGDVVAQIGGDRELPAVQGGVPEPGEAVRRGDLDRHEVPAGAGDVHVDAVDGHAGTSGAGRDGAPDDTQAFRMMECAFCSS